MDDKSIDLPAHLPVLSRLGNLLVSLAKERSVCKLMMRIWDSGALLQHIQVANSIDIQTMYIYDQLALQSSNKHQCMFQLAAHSKDMQQDK